MVSPGLVAPGGQALHMPPRCRTVPQTIEAEAVKGAALVARPAHDPPGVIDGSGFAAAPAGRIPQ